MTPESDGIQESADLGSETEEQATGLCLSPRTLVEALDLLRDEGPLVPIAGCTDVLVDQHLGRSDHRSFLNLWPLDELRGIDTDGDRLRIGALSTHAELQRSTLVRETLPILAEAAATIGGPQIQSRGTLGGNLVNASPAGDTLPVLAVAQAMIELRSAGGTRQVAFDAFYTGYRQTVCRDDELVTAVLIPKQNGRQWFRKVGTRAASAISKVVLAAVLDDPPRIAAGSLAATVVRLSAVEAAIAAGGNAEAAASALDQDVTPIDDVRSTANYRRRVTQRLLRRLLDPAS